MDSLIGSEKLRINFSTLMPKEKGENGLNPRVNLAMKKVWGGEGGGGGAKKERDTRISR